MALLLWAAAPVAGADAWRVLTTFDFSSMAAVRREWNLMQWPAGHTNNECQRYVDDGEAVAVDGGTLVVTARSSGQHTAEAYRPAAPAGCPDSVKFTSRRLESKQTFR